LPVNYRLVETSGPTWLAVRIRGNVLDRVPAFVALKIDAIDPVHRQGWSGLVRAGLCSAWTPRPPTFGLGSIPSHGLSPIGTRGRHRAVRDHGSPAARRGI